MMQLVYEQFYWEISSTGESKGFKIHIIYKQSFYSHSHIHMEVWSKIILKKARRSAELASKHI
jgi:hypothetical protein